VKNRETEGMKEFIIGEIKTFVIVVLIALVVVLGVLVWFINTGGLFGRG
jgi:predicted negative regulator of RcsB-dependent stress response